MNAKWDTNKGGRDQWVAWLAEIFTEARRVLKPGGHALVWSLPRTSHWTATALENAGFEIRDSITHVFGNGYPKSLNVSAAIDKYALPDVVLRKKYEGLGTGLKPAHETWWLARAPLAEATVAANLLEWGTGALNINASRVPLQQGEDTLRAPSHGVGSMNDTALKGRWPANFLLSHNSLCLPDACTDDCPVALLDQQSGRSKSKAVVEEKGTRRSERHLGDEGGASRFFSTFYCSKASPKERNAGCDGLTTTPTVHTDNDTTMHYRPGETHKNNHPTIKSIKLMTYLVNMVTPEGGTVLDMFGGSGTTALACIQEGYNYVLIEQSPEYIDIIRARTSYQESLMEAA